MKTLLIIFQILISVAFIACEQIEMQNENSTYVFEASQYTRGDNLFPEIERMKQKPMAYGLIKISRSHLNICRKMDYKSTNQL